MTARITDKDRGAAQLRLRAAMLSTKATVTVGVQADAGSYPNGKSVAEVAAIHEFGTGTSPTRSFLRAWFDTKKGAFGADLNQVARNVLKNGIGPAAALQVLGDRYVTEIQQRMDKGIPPPLQAKTVERKARGGSTTPGTPLEDTLRLRNSIKAKVNK